MSDSYSSMPCVSVVVAMIFNPYVFTILLYQPSKLH